MALTDGARKIESVHEYIYSLLRDRKGDQWVSERGIAEQFALPRRAAREALLGLESQGLLKREPQRGYRLASYENTSLQVVKRFRYFVEWEAGMLALKKITRQELAELMVICDDMDRASRDRRMSDMAALDLQFHRGLVEACHDTMVINVYNCFTIPIFPLQADADMSSTLEAHRKIVRALRAKDEKQLGIALKEHIGQGFSGDLGC